MSQVPSRRQLGGQSVPTAPYPPSAPSTDSNEQAPNIRSALSASPHFQPPATGSRQQLQESRKLRQYTTTSRVLFCPSQPDVYACINCVSQDGAVASTKQASQNERGSSKRSGPVLLELRRLYLHKSGVNNENDGVARPLFDSSTLATSQGNPSLGTSVASTCMAYPDLLENAVTVQGFTPCATGLSTGALCIHSFGVDDELNVSSSVTYYSTRHQRQASAVAWRPRNNSQVAIGLVSSSPGGGGSGHRQRGPRAASGGDREFCCLLWDVTKGMTMDMCDYDSDVVFLFSSFSQQASDAIMLTLFYITKERRRHPFPNCRTMSELPLWHGCRRERLFVWEASCVIFTCTT